MAKKHNSTIDRPSDPAIAGPLDLTAVKELIRNTFEFSTCAFDENAAVVDLAKAIGRIRLVRTNGQQHSPLATEAVRGHINALHEALEQARIAAWAVNNDSGPVEMLIDGSPAEIANDSQVALREQVRTLLSDDIFYQIGPGLTETLGALTYTVGEFLKTTALVQTVPAAKIRAQAPEVRLFIRTVVGIYVRCTGKPFKASDGSTASGRKSPGEVFVQECFKLASQKDHVGAHKIASALKD